MWDEKCCKDGTTLSSNGLSCVSSSKTKSLSSYYPNSNSGATKESSTKITTITSNDSTYMAGPSCGSKDERSCEWYGMYEKNGECCIDLICIE